MSHHVPTSESTSGSSNGSTTEHGRRRASEAGEGVISTAIAVLIMALLGAAMWVAFSGIFDDAAERTSEQIDTIGG